MNLNLLTKIEELKEEIYESEEYLDYKKAKKDMENDELAMVLSYKKDQAIFEYEEVIRFSSKNSKEALEALKKINKAKEELLKIPSVQIYLEKEKKLNEIIDYINKEIFDA